MKVILVLLLAHADMPGMVPIAELAPEIYNVSREYNVDAEVLTRIILVESKGVPTAKNAKTGDYGLMQISPRTAKAYHISQNCLKDWHCNLRRGAQILRDMQKSTIYRECAYNVGPAGTIRKPKACARYETLLADL